MASRVERGALVYGINFPAYASVFPPTVFIGLAYATFTQRCHTTLRSWALPRHTCRLPSLPSMWYRLTWPLLRPIKKYLFLLMRLLRKQFRLRVLIVLIYLY